MTAPAATRSPVAWITLVVVLLGGLAVDLGSKSWAFRTIAGTPVVIDHDRLLADPTYQPIPPHVPRHVLPGRLLDFELVLNRGAVFGLFENQRIFLIGFTVLALGIGTLLFARWTTSRHHMAHVAIGLVLAGGIGNLIDRITVGAVRDFLRMLPDWHLPFGLHWPGGSNEIFPWVYNVADVMLLAGMGLLIIHMFRMDRAAQIARRAAADAASTAAD
ncbi:MAG: signal peptidase II [Phycisphaerales bacterium]|nr:signal peptidase II [Phycisphaerales bacterium]